MTTSSCWVRGYNSTPSPTVQSTPKPAYHEETHGEFDRFFDRLRYILVARKNLIGYLTGRWKNLDPTGDPTGRST